jgi:hypothetical protein
MGKKEQHREDLNTPFSTFFETGNREPLETYLKNNSNLPGRRANLELGQVFAEMCREEMGGHLEEIWQLVEQCCALSIEMAPVNSADEFVPFCGTVALGYCGSVTEKYKEDALAKLKIMAGDDRWRIREAVSKGLNAMLRHYRPLTMEALASWIGDDNWLQMRGVAAGVASPSLLAEDPGFAKKALVFHETICQKVHDHFKSKSDEFMALRKGLGFTLSVVVCGVPEKGFVFMKKLLDQKDPHLTWIVKENLKKKRLMEISPAATEELKALL